MKKTLRKILPVLALVLVVAVASVGGTIAWLTATTDTVTNTFTVGDIGLTLSETTSNYKIVPGVDINKDPKVTVAADSEKCYVFVKVVESNWPTPTYTDTNGKTVRKVEYTIADEWNVLDTPTVSNDGKTKTTIIYRVVNNSSSATVLGILKNDKVLVNSSLTKGEANAITTQPTLTFTAYAVQFDGMDNNPDTAWSRASAT